MRKMLQKFGNIGKKKYCQNHNISLAWASSTHHIALFHTDGWNTNVLKSRGPGAALEVTLAPGSLCSVQESCKAERKHKGGDEKVSLNPLNPHVRHGRACILCQLRGGAHFSHFQPSIFFLNPECTALPLWESVFSWCWCFGIKEKQSPPSSRSMFVPMQSIATHYRCTKSLLWSLML